VGNSIFTFFILFGNDLNNVTNRYIVLINPVLWSKVCNNIDMNLLWTSLLCIECHCITQKKKFVIQYQETKRMISQQSTHSLFVFFPKNIFARNWKLSPEIISNNAFVSKSTQQCAKERQFHWLLCQLQDEWESRSYYFFSFPKRSSAYAINSTFGQSVVYWIILRIGCHNIIIRII